MTSPPSGIGSWSGYNGSESDSDADIGDQSQQAACSHTTAEAGSNTSESGLDVEMRDYTFTTNAEDEHNPRTQAKDQALNAAESAHLTAAFKQHQYAVCKIVTPKEENGTGILIGGDLLMTNCHVLPSPKVARDSLAIFFYVEEQAPDKSMTKPLIWRFKINPYKKSGGFYLKGKRVIDETGKVGPAEKGFLDYAIVAITHENHKAMSYLASIQSSVLKVKKVAEPQLSDPLCIIQHPEVTDHQTGIKGDRKKAEGRVVCSKEYSIYYNVFTACGSSGGAVIDTQGNFVGLHYHGPEEEVEANSCLPMNKIIADIGKGYRWLERRRKQGAKRLKEAHDAAQTSNNRNICQLLQVCDPVSRFRGRTHELELLAKHFSSSHKILFLTGHGGMGKTQLALSFAKGQTKDYVFKFRLNGSDTTALFKQLNQLADHYDVPSMDSGFLRFTILFQTSLASEGPFLIIIDGLDDPDLFDGICKCLPLNGHILITTRLSNIATCFDKRQRFVEYPLTGIGEEASVSYLLDYGVPEADKESNDVQESAKRIAQRLQCLPLALLHVIGFIKETRSSLSEYEKLLNESLEDVQNSVSRRYLNDPYDLSIYLTWKLSLDAILAEAMGKHAYNLLVFISTLPSNQFYSTILEEWRTSHEISEAQFKQASSLLHNFSLIERSLSDAHASHIHELFKEIVQYYAIKGDPGHYKAEQALCNRIIRKLGISDEEVKALSPQGVLDQLDRVREYFNQMGAHLGSNSTRAFKGLFQQLSEEYYYEPFRKVLVDALQKQPEIRALANKPNKLTGYRYSYRQKYQKLLEQICHCTTPLTEPPDRHRSGITAKLSFMTWDGADVIPMPGMHNQKAERVERYLSAPTINAVLNWKELQRVNTPPKFVMTNRTDGQKYRKSLHRVVPVEIDKKIALYFKERPTHPCMEFAVTSLLHRMFGRGATPRILACLTLRLPKCKKEVVTCVEISLSVTGVTLEKHIENLTAKGEKYAKVELNHLKSNQSFSEMLVAQLLLLPPDAFARNFIVGDREVCCIDNEASFVPIRKATSREISFNTDLFRLGNGTVHADVAKQFCELNAEELLTQWLEELIEVSSQWQTLFDQNDKKRLLRLEEDRLALKNQMGQYRRVNSVIALILPEGSITRLLCQIKRLKRFFEENISPSFLDLFKQLLTCWADEEYAQSITNRIIEKHYNNLELPTNSFSWIRDSLSTSSDINWNVFIGKTPTLGDIESGKFSPKKALEELQTTDSFCNTGCITSYKKGNPPNTPTNPLSTSQQWLYLRVLRHDPAIKHLILPNFTVLEKEHLDAFIDRHKSTIQTIDIRGCINLPAMNLEKFASLPELETLCIGGQPSAMSTERFIHPPLPFTNPYHSPSSPTLSLPTSSEDFSTFSTEPKPSDGSRLQDIAYLIRQGCPSLLYSMAELSTSSGYPLSRTPNYYSSRPQNPWNPNTDTRFNVYQEGSWLAKALEQAYGPLLNKLRFLCIELHSGYVKLRAPNLEKIRILNSPSLHISIDAPNVQSLKCISVEHIGLTIGAPNVQSLECISFEHIGLKSAGECLASVHLENITDFEPLIPVCINALQQPLLSSLKLIGCQVPSSFVEDLLSLPVPYSLKEIALPISSFQQEHIRGLVVLAQRYNIDLDLFHPKVNAVMHKAQILEKSEHVFDLSETFITQKEFLALCLSWESKSITSKLDLSGSIIKLNPLEFRDLLNILGVIDLNLDNVDFANCTYSEAFREWSTLSLKSLSIANNRFGHNAAAHLAIALSTSSIKKLDLSSNSLGDFGAKAFVKNFNNPSIETLNLSKNGIHARGAMAISQLLRTTCLSSLCLEDNYIGGVGVDHIVACLKDSQLEDLDLNMNRIEPGGAITLARSLYENGSLKRLNLKNNDISNIDVNELSGALPSSSVESLDLSNTKITIIGLTTLAHALPKCPKLKVLELWSCTLGDKGASVIASMLRSSQIERLNLGCTEIGDLGAIAIANRMKGSSLLELLLGFNLITARGVSAIAMALRSSSLTLLSIGHNQIRQRGAKAIAQALPYAKTLKQLVVDQNDIGDDGIISLANAIKASSVTGISISSNGITERGARALIDLPSTITQDPINPQGEGNRPPKVVSAVRAPPPRNKKTATHYTSFSLGSSHFPPLPPKEVSSSGFSTIRALQHRAEHQLTVSSQARNWAPFVSHGKVIQLQKRDIPKLISALEHTNLAVLTLVNVNFGEQEFEFVDPATRKPVAGRSTEQPQSIVADLIKNLYRTSIVRLALTNCSITDEDTTQLAEHLPSTPLKRLDLGGNQIADAGASSLAAVIHQTAITQLILQGNSISDAGKADLRAAQKRSWVYINFYNQ